MDSGQRWTLLRLHVEAGISLTVLSREGRRKEGAQVPWLSPGRLFRSIAVSRTGGRWCARTSRTASR